MKISGEFVCILRSSEFRTDPRVDRLANFLLKYGAHVRLVGMNRSGVASPQEFSGAVHIDRLTFSRTGKLPAGSALLAPFIGLWMTWSTLRLIRLRPSIVIACDLDAMIPSVLFARFAGSSFIYNPHDFYSDNLKKPIPNFIAGIARKLEWRLVHSAKGLILPDISRVEQYSGSALPSHIVEIVNTPTDIDSDGFDLSRYSVPAGKMLVFYGGQLSRHRGLLEIIDAVHGLSGVHLVIAGHGEHEDYIKSYVDNRSNCTFIGRVSHRDIMRLTNACSVVVAMYDPSIPNHLFASPNKLFESMCYGKPIIVNDETRLAKLVISHECGIVIPYGNRGSVARALVKLRDDINLRMLLGANGKKAFDSQYVWSIMENRLVSFFEML